MTFRRGLFRVWVVASAAWLLAVGIYAGWQWYSDPTRVFAKPGELTDFAVGLRGMLPEQYLLLAVGPPIATLLLGLAPLAVSWAAAGFRRPG